MAVYSFDSDEIERTRKELDKIASELQDNLDNCNGNLTSDLNSWSGEASDKYDNKTEDNYNTISQNINTMKAMSSYLGEVSTAIENTEDSLASIEI